MSGLTIYRASAGSGKTFAIIREYIKLLFSDADNYRRILGVTFTNKATAEMKGRILAELNNLSKGLKSDYAPGLMADYNLTEQAVQSRASYILSKIIHDYSHFTILTIDSFFQRILRVFAREAGFYKGFDIETDQDKILNVAIDQMIYELDSNPALKDWLVRFAEVRILEGANWNVNRDIEFLGKEVFKEKFSELGSNLIEKMTDKDFLDGFVISLQDITTNFETELRRKGKDALGLIYKYNLVNDDFKGKSRSIGKFFENISLGEKYNGWEISKTIYNHFNNPDQWLGTNTLKNKDIQKAYNDGLNQILGDIIDLSHTDYPIYQSAIEVQKNIYMLGVVSDLLRNIRNYASEKNIFMISDAARLLNKLLGDSDTPFVYERTGSFIRHFMIDEFQDTSKLQWLNFKPLMLNSLSEGYSNWVVGDVKQSIYRWRNSDWTILSNKIFSDLSPFDIEEKPLDYNWRSCYRIVSFNNTFFNNAVNILLNEFRSVTETPEDINTTDFEKLLSDAYNNFSQLVPISKNKVDGLVKIEFLPKDNDNGLSFHDQALKRLSLIIEQLQDNGFRLSDIAILVRTRNEGNKVSEYLLQYQKYQKQYRYDVISNDSLLLKNSEVVKWIISVYKYITQPDDRLNRKFLFYEYSRYINSEYINKDLHDCFSVSGIDFNIKEIDEFFKLKNLRKYSVFELSNKIIQHFRLSELKGELPFILAFQDMLQEYSRKSPVDINSFLQWWNENYDKIVINMPQNQDAIRLMTFHTAKGLEFKIVIIPFADWTIMKSGFNTDILWCSPQLKPFNELELIPVNISKGLQNTIFYKDYFREKALAYIDNLNLLYVAFTRAIDGLYVFVPEFAKESVNNNIGSLITLSVKDASVNSKDKDFPVINLSDYLNEATNTFLYGTLNTKPVDYPQSNENISLEQIQYIAHDITSTAMQVIQADDYLIEDDTLLATKINSGKVMHEIFQRIKSPDDVDNALLAMQFEGKISESDVLELNTSINNLLKKKMIQPWFTAEWDIYTEACILLEDGSTLRPDRVLIKKNKAVVIDYKFGRVENDSHKKQVRNYMKYLRQMNYEDIEGFVWYVTLDIVVPVELI